jgi:hypothetical protein
VWTKEQCKEILTKERVISGKTREQFWEKLFKWHADQYKAANYPIRHLVADDCLTIMSEVEKEMKLDDTNLSAYFAKAMLWPSRVVEVVAPPELPKKKSMFDRLKEKQS